MNKKINRKDFFKESLNNIGSFFNEIFSDELENLSVLFPEIIRPPGAQNEEIFQKLCNRCGECIRACPFFSLQPVFKGNQFDQGTPSLRLGEAFCRFCEDIPCIKACPTGALSAKIFQENPKIGQAKIIPANCVRSKKTDCNKCIQKCAKHANAISASSSKDLPVINLEKCTGCGACLLVCPATPDKAIKIIAR